MRLTGLAAWMIRTYRPHLTLLHIFGTDDAEHAYGPGSPEALAAIEEADGRVQEIMTAIADAGLQDRTDVVVLSDHGFLPLESSGREPPRHLPMQPGSRRPCRLSFVRGDSAVATDGSVRSICPRVRGRLQF